LADVDAKKIVADPGGSSADYGKSPGMGIVCVIDAKPSSKLQALIDAQRVVAIFEKKTVHQRSDRLAGEKFPSRAYSPHRL